jgi:hypothetical protein
VAATKKAKAAAEKKPIVRRRKKATVTHEMIQERAYHLALAGEGSPLDHWLAAERELLGV